MPPTRTSDTAPPLAAPVPPQKPLSLLNLAGRARDNFIAAFHSGLYEQGIAELRLGGLRIFVVNDPPGVRRVLLHEVDNYPKARIEHRLLGPALGKGLILSEGATWRSHRRILAPCFDQGAWKRHSSSLIEAVDPMLGQWHGVASGASVDVSDAMMTLTLDAISRSMFSSDGHRISDVVREASRDYQQAMMFGVPDFIPGIGEAWGLYKAARAKRILRGFNAAIGDMIAERGARSAAGGQAPDDLLQRLIRARNEGAMSAREVKDQVFTIFIAGHETTALALTWAWYLLSQHPRVEARLHAEVDTALGTRAACYEDVARLPYTRMIIEEAMRLYPPVHSLAFRTALRADEICNTRIPKGSIVAIVPWVLHRHRRFWEDPERFHPERFSAAQSARRERLCYLPFGFGPRVCLGASFAMTEAILVLASVARCFRLRLAPRARVEPQALFTLRPRFGMPMTLEPRRGSRVEY